MEEKEVEEEEGLKLFGVNDYASSSEEDEDNQNGKKTKSGAAGHKGDSGAHIKKKVKIFDPMPSDSNQVDLPLFAPLPSIASKEMTINLPLKEMVKPFQGPQNPFSVPKQVLQRNVMGGFIEKHFMNDSSFKEMTRTFNKTGYTLDPNAAAGSSSDGGMVGNMEKVRELGGLLHGDLGKLMAKDPAMKLDRHEKGKADDVEGFQGPWAGYKVDDITQLAETAGEGFVAEPIFDASKIVENRIVETSTFHGKEEKDYLGRSFLYPPSDLVMHLKGSGTVDENFIPKQLIHTWTGHTKGVNVIKYFPKTAHLILSGSMDNKIKIWDVYNQRQVKRTYMGHTKGVKDVSFNSSGNHFLSCSYDRWMKLWDTETGQCISRYSCKRVPFCAEFNPDPAKEHQFIMGSQDKNIYQYDSRSGDVVCTYDKHNGAVNTLTFINDEGTKFISTSDDKTLRCWQWDIPVMIKHIAEPEMHSLPAATISWDKKWLACQSLDNKIVIYSLGDKVKINRKKLFEGHLAAGFASKPGFSPDGRFLMSGDSEGKMWFWDWKTCKVYKKFKAHDGPVLGCLWHPHETSKVATCSTDGTIKFWD